MPCYGQERGSAFAINEKNIPTNNQSISEVPMKSQLTTFSAT